MRRARTLLGIFFLIIGISTSLASIYLFQEDRLATLFNSDHNLKIEIGFLLLFSILLCYSGFKTIQKEYKKGKFKQSEILDD